MILAFVAYGSWMLDLGQGLDQSLSIHDKSHVAAVDQGARAIPPYRVPFLVIIIARALLPDEFIGCVVGSVEDADGRPQTMVGSGSTQESIVVFKVKGFGGLLGHDAIRSQAQSFFCFSSIAAVEKAQVEVSDRLLKCNEKVNFCENFWFSLAKQ